MRKTKIIKKVLMCEPRHFQVNYTINPWMKIGSVDKKEAFNFAANSVATNHHEDQ